VEQLGKWIFMAGLLLSLLGGILWMGGGKGWLGRLPGDLHYEGERVGFIFRS